MKSCKIVNGRLTCKEDDIAKYSIQAPPKFKPSSTKPSVKREDITHHIHDKFEEELQNVPENHKQDIRDIFHPIIGNHITKANTQDVPRLVREKALLAKASSVYFESGKNQQQVDSLLQKNGLTNYTIDYELSTDDGLTVINNKSGKASLVFRGTKPTYCQLRPTPT